MNIYTKNTNRWFFLLLLLLLSSVVFAQETDPRINLAVSPHRTLKSIFKELEEKTSLHILYDPQVINDKIEPQGQNFNSEPVSAILRKLGFTFTISNKTVILNKFLDKKVTMLVRGQVTDTVGDGIPGVTVRLKDANRGVNTDANGKFSIDAGEYSVLTFSMTGFLPQEKVLNGADPVNIVLKENRATLNEVVVVGYGVQKKINTTGAVSSVNMDQVLGDRPVSSVGELLEGRIPGFEVTQANGAPGASLSYNVRGATDIPSTGTGNAISSQAPLILVDNVPLNGPLSLLNPNDIESVTVLKDAGAASIYGARSAFGVVLITTKKGQKNQKPVFTYSDNFTLSTPNNLPQKATVLQTLQSYKDAGTTGYWTGNDVDTWINLENQYLANPGNFPGGYAMVGTTRYDLAEHNAFKNVLGNAVQQIHNFSVSGGSDKTTYRISAGAVDQNGLLVPSSHEDFYNKYNARTFLSTEVNKWLTLQMDGSYYYSLKSSPTSGFNQAADLAPYTSLDDNQTQNGTIYPSLTPKNKVLYSTPTTDRFDDTRLTGRAILTPLSGLTITGEYTYDNLRELNTSYDQIVTFLDPRSFTLSPAGAGQFEKLNAITDYHAINIFAKYIHNFRRHHLSFLAGFNQEDSSYEEEDIERTLPISNSLPSISQSTGPITGDDNYSQYAIRGFFGRVNYDFDGKYLLELNGRNDASSKFPPGHRSGFFPSASAGWLITKEKFMEPVAGWLSQLKLRASYGTVGNQNISPYAFVPGLQSYYPYWLVNNAQVISLQPPPLVSSNFTWETVQTKNLGVDFGFLKDRLTGSFDVYQRNTKNMLYTGVQLPAVLGTGAPLQNVAALRSNGFELQLNWRDKIGSNIHYRIGANLYNYVSKITKIQNQAGLLSQYYVGQRLGEIWGYQTDRLYTANDFVPGTLNANLMGGTLKPGIPKVEGSSPNPGDVLYKDLNNDGIINAGQSTLSNPGDKKIIGNGSLQYQYGFNGAISYKDFEFSFVAQGVGKQDQYRANILSFPNFYQFGTIYAYQLNYWTPSNPNGFYPRLYDQSKGNQAFDEYPQTKYLLNGAYLKIKNLTLNYTLPQLLTRRFYVDRLQVFASVENPFLFDHLPKGSDPTINPSGTYGYDYPFMRLYSIGVNVKF